ncbi:YciI family protein [Asanoa sp. NPDC050611]|uniref:YciI family protein n=1 Tax=Asanoa sp. NPDC050611 TaxID=3157098 RepID=UPI0033C808E3
MRFLMLISGEEAAWSGTDEATRAVMGQIRDWYARWLPTGKVLPGGAMLGPAAETRTVGTDAAGRVTVTDGPYVELKEVVGGIVPLDVADADEAVAIAATWPGIVPFRETVEVRPVMN